MVKNDHANPFKILLADDGSEHAYAASDLISELPNPLNNRVMVIGVLIPRESSNYSRLEAALERTRQKLTARGIDVQTELCLGYPSELLITYAEKYSPNLIVLGAKGLRATLGIMLGGVAQQVVEYANWPVLVVRAPYKGLNRVLFVTDGSIYSDKAIDFVTTSRQREIESRNPQFSLPGSADIKIMHVLPPIPPSDFVSRTWPVNPDMVLPMPISQDDIASQYLREEKFGQEILDRSIQRLKDRSGKTAKGILVRGDAATEIIEYAKENQIDLIISGSRGLSQMKSWLLGSVSRKLVHYASCSILIVKFGLENQSG